METSLSEDYFFDFDRFDSEFNPVTGTLGNDIIHDGLFGHDRFVPVQGRTMSKAEPVPPTCQDSVQTRSLAIPTSAGPTQPPTLGSGPDEVIAWTNAQLDTLQHNQSQKTAPEESVTSPTRSVLRPAPASGHSAATSSSASSGCAKKRCRINVECIHSMDAAPASRRSHLTAPASEASDSFPGIEDQVTDCERQSIHFYSQGLGSPSIDDKVIFWLRALRLDATADSSRLPKQPPSPLTTPHSAVSLANEEYNYGIDGQAGSPMADQLNHGPGKSYHPGSNSFSPKYLSGPAPTLIDLPPPPSDPATPDVSVHGGSVSSWASVSSSFSMTSWRKRPRQGRKRHSSTCAIKDGHSGCVQPSANLDNERADRISRLAGLERVIPRNATVRWPSQAVPQSSTRELSDEELKQRYGMQLTSRLQHNGSGPEARWADISVDDEDDWAPETITWADGSTLAIDPVVATPSQRKNITLMDRNAPVTAHSRTKGPPAQDHRLYHCTQCIKPARFSTFYAWTRHEQTAHFPETIWTCRAFKEAFDSHDLCLICTKPTNDTICTHGFDKCWARPIDDRVFTRRECFTQHMKGYHHIDGPAALSLSRNREHMESLAPEIVQAYDLTCYFCRTPFSDIKERWYHIERHFQQGYTMADWQQTLPGESSDAKRQRRSQAQGSQAELGDITEPLNHKSSPHPLEQENAVDMDSADQLEIENIMLKGRILMLEAKLASQA